MFYDSELLFLQKVLEKCHIQTLLINPRTKISNIDTLGYRSFLLGSRANGVFYDYFPEIKPNTIYILDDPFKCSYLFWLLPFCETETVFLIGPYLNEDLTHKEILERSENLGLTPEKSKHLELLYASVPVIKDSNYIFALVNSFAEFLWNGQKNFETVNINHRDTVAFNENSLQIISDTEESQLTVNAMEERYNFENALIDAVASGNINSARLMMANFSSLAFENRVTDQLRNLKNYCIIMNTLFRKAAERGGVHPIYIDKTSSDFAKQIENAHTVTQITEMMPEILKAYCNLVKKNSVKGYSPPVKKVIIKIDSDLTADLSLNSMAALCNVSPSYFSALFKKETGVTLTNFVTNRRIRLAKHLLKTTNLQIQTIAQHCGILDFHYFCRMFKKNVGITPTQYRENLLFN